MATDAFGAAAREKHDVIFAGETREIRIARMEVVMRAAAYQFFATELYAWAMYASALQQRLVDAGVTALPAPPYVGGHAAAVLGLARLWEDSGLFAWSEHQRDIARDAGIIQRDTHFVRLTPAGEALRDLGRLLNDRHAAATAAPAEPEGVPADG